MTMNILREIAIFIILAVVVLFLVGIVKNDSDLRNIGLVGIVLVIKGLMLLGFFYFGWLIVKALTKSEKDD